MSFSRTGLLLAVLIFSGCASIERLPPPEDPSILGEIPEIPNTRFWGDDTPPDNVERVSVIRNQITTDPSYDKNAPVHFLALSGGGQNGAFGAGILKGWSDTGTRPEFRMVTGISTGAMTAPFAFLGPEYDVAIVNLYTKFSTKDVLKTHLIKGILSGDSVTDNSPLRNILKSYFTPKEMQLVAQQHARGRRLFVGTTYLDVQRPVIWDIGAIASSDHPNAYDLIIDVLLASTAIPGAFPPIYFKAEMNGAEYDELHVDGGVTSQIFISPVSFRMEEALKKAGLHGEARIYLIRNSKISPKADHLKPKTFPILTHSLSTLLRVQGLGDMYRIYLDAEINNMKYHAAFIPDHFQEEPEEMFDINYMTDLYKLAYTQATNGYPWALDPPEYQHQSHHRPQ